MTFPKPGQKSHRLQVRHAAENERPIVQFFRKWNHIFWTQSGWVYRTNTQSFNITKTCLKRSITSTHPDLLGVDTCDQKRHARYPMKLNDMHGRRERMQRTDASVVGNGSRRHHLRSAMRCDGCNEPSIIQMQHWMPHCHKDWLPCEHWLGTNSWCQANVNKAASVLMASFTTEDAKEDHSVSFEAN